MSDFFISDRNAQQSIINTEFNPEPEATSAPRRRLPRIAVTPADALIQSATDIFDINWPEIGRASGRTLAQLGGGVSDLGSHVLNIPNNALETPDYLIRGNETQRAATRSITDPHYADRTQAARGAANLRDYFRSTYRPGAFLARDPRPQSEATQFLSGLAEVMTPALVAGPLGAGAPATALAFSTEERTYMDMIDRGVRENVARGAALQDASFMAAMGVAPISAAGAGRTLVTRLIQRGASGAVINLAFGAAMRGNMNAYLTEQGYPEIARDYQYLDTRAMLIDGIMGATFGAIFGHSLPPSAEPHVTPMAGEVILDAAEQQLPQDADGFIDEARLYGNDQQLPEAYAYALIARELGHPEADDLIASIEEEVGAADLEQGRSIASEIIDSNLANDLRGSDLAAAALVEAGRINEETAFGIPENQASRRWQSEAQARMEEQAARDEPIDPGPVPDDVSFVPLPDNGASEHWDAAMRAFEEEAQEAGLADMAANIRRMREERGDVLGEPEDGAMFSRARRRGDGEERGSEPFHDDRLSPQQNKAVEMARNNYSNREIADELDVSNTQVAVVLANAKSRIGDLGIEPARLGAPAGTHRGHATATIQDIVRLYNKLARQGYRNRPGRTTLGRRNLNTVLVERLGLDVGNVAKRLSIYRADLKAGRVEGEPLFSRRADGARFSTGENGFSSVEQLKATAVEELGADWSALSQSGRVEIVPSLDVLVQALRDQGLPSTADYVAAGDPDAAYIPALRKTYFVADRISPERMRAVILHEIGVHHGMQDLLGPKGWNEVLRQIGSMLREEHPAIVDARERALEAGTPKDRLDEETFAYLIENKADLPLVQRALSRLRQWLIKTFGTTFGMRLTVDDLRALALTSLRRVAEQARRDAVEAAPIETHPLFSADGPDAGSGGAGPLFPELGANDRGGLRRIGALGDGEFIDSAAGQGTMRAPQTMAEALDSSMSPLPTRGAGVADSYARSLQTYMQRDDWEGYSRTVRIAGEAGPVALVRTARALAESDPRFAARVGDFNSVNDLAAAEDFLTWVRRSNDPWFARQAERAQSAARRTQSPDGGASGAGQRSRAPTLTPAVRVNGRIYEGETHLRALGEVPDAERAAAQLDGRNRGYVDDRGRFINNERATEYARNFGLIRPEFQKYAGSGAEIPSEWMTVTYPRRAPDAPNAGDGAEFPRFSRQNPDNLVGAKRDPIESPDYQQRINALRSGGKEGGAGEASGRPGEVGGVRGDTASSGRRAGSDARSGEGPPRAVIQETLAVSAIRIIKSPVRKSGLGFGALRAEIDTPVASDVDSVLQAAKGAEGGRTGIDFDLIDGSDPKETRLPGVYLRLTRINDGAKGTGAGVWLYRQIVDWADRQGLPVYSDFSVSAEAQRVYPALERRGYRIEQINAAVKDLEDGSLVNTNFQPIFRISRTGIEEAYDAAPLPHEDYQIDGPTLRERQQRIDDQRARQEEYDKLAPAEQAVIDNPDGVMFSRRREKLTTREALRRAREQHSEAAEMRKAFEAAARCAARHGAGQGARYAAAASGDALLGHAIGLTLAIPFGVTAAPILARIGNPERYWANRKRFTMDQLAPDAMAASERLGELAGMEDPASVEAPADGENLYDLTTDQEDNATDATPTRSTGQLGMAPPDAEFSLAPNYVAARGDVNYQARYRSSPTATGSHIRTSDISFDQIPDAPQSARVPVAPATDGASGDDLTRLFDPIIRRARDEQE